MSFIINRYLIEYQTNSIIVETVKVCKDIFTAQELVTDYEFRDMHEDVRYAIFEVEDAEDD